MQRGLVSRVMGIMLGKAFKMQEWVVVGRFMERNFPHSPMSRWLVCGAAATAQVLGCVV